jgi:hypothetical protein
MASKHMALRSTAHFFLLVAIATLKRYRTKNVISFSLLCFVHSCPALLRLAASYTPPTHSPSFFFQTCLFGRRNYGNYGPEEKRGPSALLFILSFALLQKIWRFFWIFDHQAVQKDTVGALLSSVNYIVYVCMYVLYFVVYYLCH